MQRRLQIIHTFRALCFFVLLLSLFFPLTYRWPYNLICRLKCSFLNNTQSLPPKQTNKQKQSKDERCRIHQFDNVWLIISFIMKNLHCLTIIFLTEGHTNSVFFSKLSFLIQTFSKEKYLTFRTINYWEENKKQEENCSNQVYVRPASHM